MINLVCQLCHKPYSVHNCRKYKSKFCSLRCNMLDKHKRFGQVAREKAKETMIGNKYRCGKVPWNKGIKTGKPSWNSGKTGLQIAWNKGKKQIDYLSKESLIKVKQNLLKMSKSGKYHWNWRGGITDKNHKIRCSIKYKEWRTKILQRDKFSCVMCGYRSHKRKDIRVDHIKPFSLYPELRFDINNGRTLCIPCDIRHGWSYSKYRRKIKK